MEKPNRVRQIYGYMVCLVAVVTALLCLNGAVGNAINLADPAAAAGEFGENIESYEAWMGSRAQMRPTMEPGQTADTTSEATHRARYEAARRNSIARVSFRSRKGLITQGIVLITAVLLFATHWKWLRNSD
jgi:hypothetical protein